MSGSFPWWDTAKRIMGKDNTRLSWTLTAAGRVEVKLRNETCEVWVNSV